MGFKVLVILHSKVFIQIVSHFLLTLDVYIENLLGNSLFSFFSSLLNVRNFNLTLISVFLLGPGISAKLNPQVHVHVDVHVY